MYYTLRNNARLRIHYSATAKEWQAELSLADGTVARHSAVPPDGVAYLIRWAAAEDAKVQAETPAKVRL
jgi:hypothetical protein